MAVITHVLVQLSVIVVWTRAQAPGDGANLCLSAQLAKAPYPPQFPKNVVPLMDSYDYLSLLTLPPPGMDTWKAVDVDGDNHYVSSRVSVHACACACARILAHCFFFLHSVVCLYAVGSSWQQDLPTNTSIVRFLIWETKQLDGHAAHQYHD